MADAMDGSTSEISSSSIDDEYSYPTVSAHKPQRLGHSHTTVSAHRLGCSCHTACAHGKGKGACPCKAADVSCTFHCSCGKKKACKNNKKSRALQQKVTIKETAEFIDSDSVANSSAPITPVSHRSVPTASRKQSPSASATTRGGCSFDDLIRGMKYYVCDNSYLLDLEEEMIDEEETIDELDEREITNRRVTRLINHVDGILESLEGQDKEIESFCIGKTYATRMKKKKFSKMNHNTWIKDGISARWFNKYKKEDYDGLIVFTVVTKELVPPKKKPKQKYPDQQMYALMLEQRLLHYYCIENYDSRIANTSFSEGMKSGKKTKKSGKKTKKSSKDDDHTPHSGHPLYIAVKFKEENDTFFE